MLEAFEVFVPTRVVFGWGAIGKLGDIVAPLGDSLLLVTGRHSSRDNGLLAEVTAALQRRGIRVTVLEGVAPNPRCALVDEGARLARAQGLHSVVGLGGGSTIDTAKAIAVAVMGDRPVAHYVWGKATLPTAKLPLVAIPTTAGTGAELSRGAILTDDATGRKGGLRGEVCLPTLAVVDPQLTVSLPPAITAETGFDAWCHAIETFVSRKANPFTEALSLRAMERIVKFLPRAVRNGADREARLEMSAASLMMGWNLGLSTTCLPHRLQYPVGAKSDSTHARGLAALHTAWIRQAAPLAPDKFACVSRILADGYCGGPASAFDCADRERAFMEDIGMITSLGVLGITKAECEILTDQVTGDVASDPGPSDRAAILRIYQSSI
jgi:alcohol dehydrogenase class IV